MDARLALKWGAAVGCTLGGLHVWQKASSPQLAPIGWRDARPLDDGSGATSARPQAASTSRQGPEAGAPADSPSSARPDPARDRPEPEALETPQADAPRSGSADRAAADSPDEFVDIVEIAPLPSAFQGEPRIPEPLARAAMRYVGLDPAAEAIWALAINDMRLPASTREDLIQDIDEETLPDPRNITEADVPLILARLGIIERLAPRATDETNVSSFGEAYKDLLEELVKIRTTPRGGRSR